MLTNREMDVIEDMSCRDCKEGIYECGKFIGGCSNYNKCMRTITIRRDFRQRDSYPTCNQCCSCSNFNPKGNK